MESNAAQAAITQAQPPAGTAPAASAQTAPATQTAATQDTSAQGEPEIKDLPEAVQALIRDLRRENAANRTKARDAEAKAKADAEAKLKEQGEFKTLAETAARERDTLKAELDALKLNEAKRAIAKEIGLPDALALRITGSTPEELKADAKAMLEALPKPVPPSTDATNRGGAKPKQFASEAEKREFAARYGVDPRYLSD